MFVEKSENE